jgi:hypothetical protein
MKDYGIDVYAQCIGGKVVFVRKPLVFKDDKKPFFDRNAPINLKSEKVERVCSVYGDQIKFSVKNDAVMQSQVFCVPPF